ncbi:MAG: nitroreductase [Bacteroidetes bacterium]|nr:nitroreductase [Bacteroidota bacterium]MDA1122387.1 nitroreductase [Bacteroidota bacterium]
MKFQTLNEIIKGRRSVFPPDYLDKEIPDKVILELLENANWAPTHKLTEPWRFKVVKDEAKKRLGNFLAEKYKSSTPRGQFLQKKYNKLQYNSAKSGAVILICFQRDPEEKIPEWEELASVAAAVQNLWLSCHAHGIGAYWSTPGVIKYMDEFAPLAKNEKCLGIFYMGYYKDVGKTSNRNPIQGKMEWISE